MPSRVSKKSFNSYSPYTSNPVFPSLFCERRVSIFIMVCSWWFFVQRWSSAEAIPSGSQHRSKRFDQNGRSSAVVGRFWSLVNCSDCMGAKEREIGWNAMRNTYDMIYTCFIHLLDSDWTLERIMKYHEVCNMWTHIIIYVHMDKCICKQLQTHIFKSQLSYEVPNLHQLNIIKSSRIKNPPLTKFP